MLHDRSVISKRARNRLAAIVASLAVAGAASVALASPAAAAGGCQSGHFCGFRDINYGGGKVIDSTARCGSRVDVPDNVISSVSNRTGNRWIGKNNRTGLPDQTLITIPPFTDRPNIGSANDKIDYFEVRC